MATVLATQKTGPEIVFGTYGDLSAFAKRIKLMCKGGDKLSENEALALAQVATVTHLNPFIGEVWYIPGKGPMVGIAGARRTDQASARDNGNYSSVEVVPCAPEEAGANEAEIKEVVAAFRAEITDSGATMTYQKMFLETLAALRESGIADPIPVAREICGPRPKWVGYGFSKRGDQSTMNKTQLARKRAEADALKKKIVLPFGADVADSDVSPDYVDAQTEPVMEIAPKTVDENLHDLGVDTEPIQMYRYNDAVIIALASKILNFSTKDAARTLYEAHKSGKLGTNLTLDEAEQFCKELIEPK